MRQFSCRQVLLLSAGLIGLLAPMAGRAAEPATVVVSQPLQTEVADREEFTGRLEAAARVVLRARVTGYLEKVHFNEGDLVKKGQLLFEIDARTYKVALDKARADLKVAEARLITATRNYTRLAVLRGRIKGAVSMEEFDKAAADRDEARARVAAAQANVEVSKLNLDFSQVRAPIDGRIGRILLTTGNLVVADTTLLATLVSRDPLYVAFDMPERTYLRYFEFLRLQQKKELASIRLRLATEENYSHKATLTFVDNQINANTGTIRLRGVLPNSDQRLLPGMFVRVQLTFAKVRKALLVSKTAVSTFRGKPYLLVVNDKNVVERRPVKVGKQLEGLRIITAGLKADEWVIVAGLKRLKVGDKVKPSYEAMPRPASIRPSEAPRK